MQRTAGISWKRRAKANQVFPYQETLKQTGKRTMAEEGIKQDGTESRKKRQRVKNPIMSAIVEGAADKNFLGSGVARADS